MILLYKDHTITQRNRVISKGFECEDGVFVKSLEMALKSFNVERQAYHGGSFIGNHVHKALQVLTFIIKSYLVFLFIQPENIEISSFDCCFNLRYCHTEKRAVDTRQIC